MPLGKCRRTCVRACVRARARARGLACVRACERVCMCVRVRAPNLPQPPQQTRCAPLYGHPAGARDAALSAAHARGSAAARAARALGGTSAAVASLAARAG
eukprot:6177431-Pleurochrysis_carterae.AAC.4